MEMTRLYVSTSGSDGGDGSRERPFASLIRARDGIRAIRERGSAETAEITVIEGVYPVKGSLELDARDKNVAWKAEGRAVISGGVTLTDKILCEVPKELEARFPSEARKNIKAYDLKKLGLTAKDWGEICAVGFSDSARKYDGGKAGGPYCELYVGGKRMELAGYPNNGFIAIEDVLTQGDCAGNLEGQEKYSWETVRNPRSGTFTVSEADFAHFANFASLDDVWLFGYFCYDWADMSAPVAAIDCEKRSITPAYVSYYGYKKNARFRVFNVPEELDAPGEWYLDRGNGIACLYMPKEGGEVVLSVITDTLISADGADGVSFEGFTLEGTRGNGIVAKADGVSVKGCVLRNLSGNAVSLSGCHNLVSDCEIYGIGGDAVALSGGDRQRLVPSGSVVKGCRISRWSEYGRTYRAAVRLRGVGLCASGNLMYDAPHLAVTYHGNDIIIEKNEIHDVCYETVDGGAVYAGRNWTMYGCIVRHNYIHDVNARIDGEVSFASHPAGVYLDDALSGQEVYGNVFSNLKGWGAVVVGGGRDVTVRDNIFINTNVSVHYDDRAREGFVKDGWFAHMVLPENGFLWERLGDVPYKEGIWAEKYPTLASISTDRSDPDSPDFPCNPTRGTVEGNVICGTGTDCFEIDKDVYRYGKVSNNVVIGRK